MVAAARRPLVFESYDGRAFGADSEENASPRATSTPQRWIV
jgi:hypothetical protein